MRDDGTILRQRHRVAGALVRANLIAVRIALKAGFREDQLRDDRGRWSRDGRVVVTRVDRTGNERIDRKTDILLDVAKDTISEIGPGSGKLYGLAVHSQFAKAVRELDLPGIGRNGVEESFSLGDTVRYGLNGSVRTDVILRDGRTTSAPILAVYDLKTGTAVLEPARVDEIRTNLGIGKDVPIIEIHIDRGPGVKGRKVQISFALCEI